MNILIIAPFFNDYQEDIKKNMEKRGHNVKCYSCSYKASNFEKIINISYKKYISIKYNEYIDGILKENNDYIVDKFILIFGGADFNKYHLLKFKEKYKNAEFICYNWDSITNYPTILEYYHLFDRCYSFDKVDCEKYGFRFLPLFYSNNYIEIKPVNDVFTIMSYSRNKSKDYKIIKSKLSDKIKIKEYLLIPNKAKYLLERVLRKKYLLGIPNSIIHHKPLPRKNVYYEIASAKAILDIPRKNQCGLTMRTFEVLNQRRKLITTNPTIINYDFYCEQNIFIVTNSTTEIPNSFFEEPFNNKFCLKDIYSLDTFVEKLLYGKE